MRLPRWVAGGLTMTAGLFVLLVISLLLVIHFRTGSWVLCLDFGHYGEWVFEVPAFIAAGVAAVCVGARHCAGG